MKELQNYAAILVAAGLSSRFGADDKLLTEICGAPLICWSLKPLLNAGLGQIIVVTGANDEQVREICKDQSVVYANNSDPSSGLGSSIATGASAVRERVTGVFICLGDMPLIPPLIFEDLANTLAADEEVDAAAPVHDGKRGHPVVFHHRHLAALRNLTRDEGAKSVLKTPGFNLIAVPSVDLGILTDLDTPEQFKEIERRLGGLSQP